MSIAESKTQNIKVTSRQAENVNILVIEDDTEELTLLNDVLVHEGYQVRPTQEGSAGLRAARLLPPDIILLDIKLSGEDGFAICRQLKEDPFLQDIPVIFISGLSDIDSHVKGFQLGARDFITKPFQELEVLVRIQNQLEIVRLQRKHIAYAQLLERHQIARDLHDSVSQTLFALGTAAQALTLTEPNLPAELQEHLTYVHRLSQIASEEMRLSLFELNTHATQQLPIEQLLSQLIKLLVSRTDAEFSLQARHDSALLTRDVVRNEAVYRIAREAIFNAVKHAKATQINILITGSEREGQIIVEDNGIGFDKLKFSASGAGLANMRQRAEETDIALAIDSTLGHGTKIQANWMYMSGYE